MEAAMFSNSSDPSARDSALQPSEQRRLEEAEHLLEDGKPAQAAPIFAKLAEVLASAGQPKRAASLHAQAALAFAQSRNESPALTQARAALNLFIQYRLGQAADFYYKSITSEMTKRGMKNAAATLEKEFVFRINHPFLHPVPETAPTTPSTPSPAARLPSNCPQCGAPVHVSDAHWNDAGNVECAYCGTPIWPMA
jgi:hypothetical protein